MTASAAQREEAEGTLPESPEPDSSAHGRSRASSVATALPLPQPPDLAGEGEGHAPSRQQVVLTWLRAYVPAVLARELDLIHGPPPSLKTMHARHQQAAAHWNGALPRGLRAIWGLLHTAVYSALLSLADATFSPAGAVLTVLAVLALIYWL